MFEQYAKALDSIDQDKIRSIAQLLADKVENGGRIFLAGNGGSSCVAQHMASDLMKAVGDQKTRSCQAINLTDNTALMTALANDCGYDAIFTGQAVFHECGEKDVVVGFSVSGHSTNLTRLFEFACIRMGGMIMVTGDHFGSTHSLEWNRPDALDLSIETGFGHSEPQHYYICESVFSCIAHAIVNEFHILRGNYAKDAEK